MDLRSALSTMHFVGCGFRNARSEAFRAQALTRLARTSAEFSLE